MKLMELTPVQAGAIAQAMQAVVTAEGRVIPLPIERDSLIAIQRHLLRLPEPLDSGNSNLPYDLVVTLSDPLLRLETIRILSLLPILDQQVVAEKVAVVEAATRQLQVDDRGPVLLRQALRRQHRRMGTSILLRSVAHYWSPTGRARLRDWFDMVRIAMPRIPGLYAMLTDQDLLARYQALGQKPQASFGYVLHEFYVRRGFPLPGEPNSFPEGWGKHEAYHVLSEYDTNLQGEMLNAAFSGGNTEYLSMDLLMATLLQFHAGRQVLPGPCLTGLLEPDPFFRAVARGAAMRVDLLKGWDLWSVVDRPLQELRSDFQIPPLHQHEREALAAAEALIV